MGCSLFGLLTALGVTLCLLAAFSGATLVSFLVSGLLDMDVQPHGVLSATVSPRVVGIIALSSGDIFSAFDFMDTGDGLITLKDMDSMLMNFGDDPVPWAHFLYETHTGDHRRYALPAIAGRNIRYNNLFLRDIVMQADIDGDGAVNETELNATMWRSSFIHDVVTDVLRSQSALTSYIVSSLTTIGITNSSLVEHLSRRNASESHGLRDVSLGTTQVLDDSIVAAASSFNRTWEAIVDDFLDLFDMFIQETGESDHDFQTRFMNGRASRVAIPILRQILVTDLAGKLIDKPYEQLTTSLSPQAAVVYDTNEWISDTDL